MCISKRVLLFGNTQTLNFFNSHLFFDVGLIHCVFFRIQSILTHTHRGEKETTSTSSIHTRHGLITIHVYTLSSSSFTRVSLFISYIWKHFHSIPQELWTSYVREPTKKLLQLQNISNYPTTCSPQSAIQRNFKDPYVTW